MNPIEIEGKIRALEVMMYEGKGASELRSELNRVREMLRRECADWVEDHTYAQTVAKRVGVPVEKVEGDSYGVPGIRDLIDMIAERIPPNEKGQR